MHYPKLYMMISCLLLSSCMGSKPQPPIDIYTIQPAGVQPTSIAEQTPLSQVIKLAPIRATRPFSSTDMLYTDATHGQNAYAYSRWSDAPTNLLHHLFQLALEQSQAFRAAIPSSSASKAHYLLETTLFDFSHHITASGASEGVIHIRFHLIDQQSRQVVDSHQSHIRVEMQAENAKQAATALNKAALKAAEDLIEWLHQR